MPDLTPSINNDIWAIDHNNMPKYVRVYAHVLRSPVLGINNSGQSVIAVNDAMETAYEAYDPLGIHLLWDGNINYIDDENLYQSLYNDNNFTSLPNHIDGVDIYFYDNNQVALGTANFNNTQLKVGGISYDDATDNGVAIFIRDAIVHELGHIFGLYHTFHGYVFDPNFPNACQELVNGDAYNRFYCGDYVQDTPADYPNSNDYIDQDCNYFGDIEDPAGDQYQPLTNNYMSYTKPGCFSSFTPKQKNRMKNSLGFFSQLQPTQTQNYTYIRGPKSICDVPFNDGIYDVYSHNLNGLTFVTSPNLSIVTNTTINNSIRLMVEHNLDVEAEGESAFIEVRRNGVLLTKQNIWLGKPESADGALSGATNVFPGDQNYYTLNKRLEGALYYQWDPPGEGEQYVDVFTGNTNIWQVNTLGWALNQIQIQAGTNCGEFKVYGINECTDNPGPPGTLEIDTNQGPGSGCEPDPPTPIFYYPNPSDGLLQIDLTLQEYGTYDIVIYDSMQMVAKQDQCTNIMKQLELFDLVNGTYYLHIYHNGTNVLQAILVVNH